MSAFVHVHWAETEAKHIILACLSRALPVALSINQLLFISALRHYIQARSNASSIVINHAIWAHRGAHVTLSDNKAWWALRVPLILALLTLMALLILAVSSPERQRLLTSVVSLLKELGAIILDVSK